MAMMYFHAGNSGDNYNYFYFQESRNTEGIHPVCPLAKLRAHTHPLWCSLMTWIISPRCTMRLSCTSLSVLMYCQACARKMLWRPLPGRQAPRRCETLSNTFNACFVLNPILHLQLSRRHVGVSRVEFFKGDEEYPG